MFVRSALGDAMAALTPLLVLLVVLGVVLGIADRWLTTGTLAGPHGLLQAARPSVPATGRRPLQVVAADLRRLARQLALVPAGAPLVRWQALWTAYDAVLMEAAQQLEVEHELGATCVGMPRDIERLRVLAALESAGLVVRG
jgi:hypothetical protein